MTDNVSLFVDVQDALNLDASENEKPPSALMLSEWAQTAHRAIDGGLSELTIRLVGEPEMIELNQHYRGKEGSTNVLSFAVDHEFDFSVAEDPCLLGDVVICHDVIVREAFEQKKSIKNHYAHMVTHGVLHLHGYDHLDDESAVEMEALETHILSISGIETPYN